MFDISKPVKPVSVSRKVYALALVRTYDVKPFVGLFDLETAERNREFLSRKTNCEIVVINMESINA